MAAPTMIFCCGGNRRYYEIARACGFEYGARLPSIVYGSLYFADQDWKRPNRAAYMAALAEHRPYLASVMDWERADQLPDVLAWAEEAARYVQEVMIIPKVQGGVKQLPREIGGKPVRLGYSIPTTHGGTALPYLDFRGWPVHLLGGSPHKQMRLAAFLNVVSMDGNMMMKMANSCRFWRKENGKKGHWVELREVGDGNWGADSNYEAFRRSCVNVMVEHKEAEWLST